MKIKQLIFVCCSLVLILTSCNNYLDVKPKGKIIPKTAEEYSTLLHYWLDEIEKGVNSTIVTMIGGSPVEMPWEEKAGTILWSYYAGMESGTALAGILTGRINPSGKLAETFPRVYEDTPTGHNGQFGRDDMVCYEEEIMVGYRHYEKNDILPM